MAKYELLYIVHPDLEASIDKITDRAKSIIENRKGTITYEENWGKRKLAYPIKKAEVGIYVLWFFEAPTASLSKIERDLRLTEEIIRYMILAAPDKVKASKAKKAKETEKKTEEPKVIAAETKEVKAKTTVKKKKAAPVENEKERMKKLDEKLGVLLGDEDESAK